MRKLAVLVVVLAVGAAVWMSGVGHTAVTTASATEVPRPAAAVAPAAPAAPSAGEQTIRITEAELTQRIDRQLLGQPLGSTPLGTATLKTLTAQLANGHLVANGDAQVALTTVPVSMTASGTVQNGRAVVAVDDLRAAGMPLPASTRQSVQRVLQQQVDDEVSQQNIRVRTLSIDNGALTLTGTLT